MSLDIYLFIPGADIKKDSSRIFIREGGQTISISEEEWQDKNPGREPVRYIDGSPTDNVWNGNITHNLAKMAKQCSALYEMLWRPEESGITKAWQLITPLEFAIQLLENKDDFFKQFNPANGWGTYELLLKFVKDYREACVKYPNADVKVSR